ncbi:hypothetical protein FQN60_015265 [Etheostoma spectabile]|uniref:Secreted protein n=1 Tax=Etheostoma spectabile TaxID=54343 RepID=A0A5J5CQP5_9PERO|nr:hypothetical protein FQN60_015265 [Etheostoma spectabile]
MTCDFTSSLGLLFLLIGYAAAGELCQMVMDTTMADVCLAHSVRKSPYCTFHPSIALSWPASLRVLDPGCNGDCETSPWEISVKSWQPDAKARLYMGAR